MPARIHTLSVERFGETIAIAGACVNGCGGVSVSSTRVPPQVGADRRLRGAAKKIAKSKALRRLASSVLKSARNAPLAQAEAALEIAKVAERAASQLDRDAVRNPESEDSDVYA